MIAILSPAKTLDFTTKYSLVKYTHPEFLKDTELLIHELKKMNSIELASLMNISSQLSELNFKRYLDWSFKVDLSNARQSILCFKGGVYKGLDVDSFSSEDLSYSQTSIRILSGLYGLLKPFDLIQPYRLEMGTKLPTLRGNNLYDFWDTKISTVLNKCLDKYDAKFILNLASNEYFSVIKTKKINRKIIDVKFLDKKNDDYKIISFFAKKARGAMAAFVVKNKIKLLNDLKDFTSLGYSFNKERSSDDTLVFLR